MTSITLHDLFAPMTAKLVEVEQQVEALYNKLIFNPSTSYARLGWQCACSEDSITSLGFTSGLLSNAPVQCHSTYEFVTALVPCFILHEGSLFFRNLERKTVTASVSGALTLNKSEVIGDGPIVVLYNGKYSFYDIPTSSSNTYTINLALSGEIEYTYSSRSQANNITGTPVWINEKEQRTLSQFDFWNPLDELGLLFGIKRFRNEANAEFLGRLRTAGFIGAPTKSGLVINIGRDLGTVTRAEWNGDSQLTLNSATAVKIKDYPIRAFVAEDLNRVGNTYKSVLSNLSPVVLEFPDRVVYTTESSGFIDYSAVDNTAVIARYATNLATLETSGDYITGLLPNENTPRVDASLVYATGIAINPFPTVYQDMLFNGRATSELLYIAEIIQQKAQAALGYVPWGKAVWLRQHDLMPRYEFIHEGLE